LKQSKTKDQTRKGANIKGSNYNFVGGLITKTVKTSMAKLEEPKRRRFHHSLSSNSCECVTIMEGDVSSDNGAILESMGRVSRLTSLATVMHASLLKMLASSSYKSQRRSRTREREERGEREERLQKQKGIQLRRTEENRRDWKNSERAKGRGEQIRFGSVFTRKKQPNRKKERPETEPEPAQTGRFRSGFLDKKPDKPIGLFWAYFGLFNRLFNGLCNGLLMDFY